MFSAGKVGYSGEVRELLERAAFPTEEPRREVSKSQEMRGEISGSGLRSFWADARRAVAKARRACPKRVICEGWIRSHWRDSF